MLILGLDPGSRCTGYGLIVAQGQRLRWVEGGVWKLRGDNPLHVRLRILHGHLEGLLERVGPEAVAMEECFMGRHARAALVLGHARGALMVAAMASGASFHEYAPRLVKQAVTGAGGASKHQVQMMVRHLVAGTPATLSEDGADALAVAVCHAHRIGCPATAVRMRVSAS